MNNEIVEKIERISEKDLTEAEVGHLFTLVRKLIERVPKSDRPQYALLKFYCDWTVHSKIDRSEEGAKIIEKVHDIILKHFNKSNTNELITDLTSVLSLDDARKQLNQLANRYRTFNVYDQKSKNLFSESRWLDIIKQWAEIVSKIPLRINPRNRLLSSILSAIQARPIGKFRAVDELEIVKMPAHIFRMSNNPEIIIFCIMITMTDTTHIIAPILLPK